MLDFWKQKTDLKILKLRVVQVDTWTFEPANFMAFSCHFLYNILSINQIYSHAKQEFELLFFLVLDC